MLQTGTDMKLSDSIKVGIDKMIILNMWIGNLLLNDIDVN